MRLDEVAYAALQRGDDARVKRIFLGPELRLFDEMAGRADELARYEARGPPRPRRRSTTRARTRARADRGGPGRALVIILLLVTASDIARMALEASGRVRGQ